MMNSWCASLKTSIRSDSKWKASILMPSSYSSEINYLLKISKPEINIPTKEVVCKSNTNSDYINVESLDPNITFAGMLQDVYSNDDLTKDKIPNVDGTTISKNNDNQPIDSNLYNHLTSDYINVESINAGVTFSDMLQDVYSDNEKKNSNPLTSNVDLSSNVDSLSNVDLSSNIYLSSNVDLSSNNDLSLNIDFSSNIDNDISSSKGESFNMNTDIKSMSSPPSHYIDNKEHFDTNKLIDIVDIFNNNNAMLYAVLNNISVLNKYPNNGIFHFEKYDGFHNKQSLINDLKHSAFQNGTQLIIHKKYNKTKINPFHSIILACVHFGKPKKVVNMNKDFKPNYIQACNTIIQQAHTASSIKNRSRNDTYKRAHIDNNGLLSPTKVNRSNTKKCDCKFQFTIFLKIQQNAGSCNKRNFTTLIIVIMTSTY